MKFRKIFFKTEEILNLEKIVFILGPRQVGKTTFLKYLFDKVKTPNKAFLNLENFKYREIFSDIGTFEKFLSTIKIKWNEKIYLFLDEFHKVRGIDKFLKIIYDDYPFVKVIASGSNNLEINRKITESLAWRKRVYMLYSLDFDEFISWKENIDLDRVKNFILNPINKSLILQYLDEFLKFWWYPEVVLAKSEEEKKKILEDIFSYWFNKDIILETDKLYEIKQLIKYLSFSFGDILNMSSLASLVNISVPTVKRLIYLLEETFNIFLLRPFFRNKIKELKKSPKIYFFDLGFRNWIIDRYEFSLDEKWYLFEGFIIQELIKRWYRLDNLKFWRTKDWRYEVDLIVENKNIAIEIKYKLEKKVKKTDYKSLVKFKDVYDNFETILLNLDNFYEIIINNF